MDNDALKQVQDRLAELPADVREAIQSVDLEKKVQAVGAKNNLHVDQIGELGDEVMLAMLGFLPLEEFDKRLIQVLSVSPEVATKLAADIGTDVFAPIRESMKQWAANRAAKAPVVDAQPAAVKSVATTVPIVSATAKLPVSPALQKVDVMLSQQTVSPTAAPTKTIEPPKPVSPIYKADPYREPV